MREMSPFRHIEDAYNDALDRVSLTGKRAHIIVCNCGNVMLGLHFTVHTGPSEAFVAFDKRRTVKWFMEDTATAFIEAMKPEPRFERIARENLRADFDYSQIDLGDLQ